MFTGIVQGIGRVAAVHDRPGLRSMRLDFPDGFARGLTLGASVAVDGVCLTVTALHAENGAEFDAVAQSLATTTLAELESGTCLNVERAARDGAEIGGHPLSGHVDFTATIDEVRLPENNHVVRFRVPPPFMRYIFAKGYIAIDGASLTVAEVDRRESWFEVWLIPETLRMTTLGNKSPGDRVNVELDRGTQVVVDTLRDALDERLGPVVPLLESLLRARGLELGELMLPASKPPGRDDA